MIAYEIQHMEIGSIYENSVTKVEMEDSLFPFISDNYNKYIASTDEKIQSEVSLNADEQSDMEEDSMPESQIELTEADVYTQLEHKERDLILAAELGKSLLEKNDELAQENDRLSHEYHEQFEILEQENHELRRRLDCKISEYEACTLQLSNDLKRKEEEVEERQGMLAAVQREKSRAVEELSEQNHKLLSQLRRASQAEEQLSSQVQKLRKEFLERSESTTVKIMQLESQKEEIEEDSRTRSHLESNFDLMKDETIRLREDLSTASEKIHQLERQLYDKERELKRVSAELNDAHVSNTQLQVRIDELREEMTLQSSFTSNGDNSLLSELEQSGVDVIDLGTNLIPQCNDDPDQLTYSETNRQKNHLSDDTTAELSLQCYQALLSGVESCHQHIFKLKQEMWEVYQRIQSVCSELRTFVNKNQSPTKHEKQDEDQHNFHSINLSTALSDLSRLVHEAISTKELMDDPKDVEISTLKEKQESLQRDLDEAVATRHEFEVNLMKAKVDLMSVNSQLLEAIQQKLQQQRELEAWQDDMEHMIQKGLNERSVGPRTLHQTQAANQQLPSRRLNWFSFSRKTRQLSDESSNSGMSQTSESQIQEPPDSDGRPGLFASWLKRRQNPQDAEDIPS